MLAQLENLGRLSTRHLVLFVTLQEPELRAIVDAAPDATPGSFGDYYFLRKEMSDGPPGVLATTILIGCSG